MLRHRKYQISYTEQPGEPVRRFLPVRSLVLHIPAAMAGNAGLAELMVMTVW